MFRNSYDNDVTIWSPEGRLHQVEYAQEAENLGSATVGLKSSLDTVLVCFKKSSSSLSAFQKKIIQIDQHIGMAFSGVTSDAKILTHFMRVECLTYKYSDNVCIPVERLVSKLTSKMHIATQRYDARPFGIGLLVAGLDDVGPHLYEICPSANYYDCKAMAIGNRSQSAKTYLQKNLTNFPSCHGEELIKHGLRALHSTLPGESNLNMKNTSIGIVGSTRQFKILGEADVANYLTIIKDELRKPGEDCDKK